MRRIETLLLGRLQYVAKSIAKNAVHSRAQLAAFLMLAGFVVLTVMSVGVQADPQAKPNPETKVATDSVVDWHAVYSVIDSGYLKVVPILRKGCFDCHTNQTHYPWYHVLPGIKQLIDSDIKNARKRLDMSKGFPFDARRWPADDLSRMRGVLTGHDMPPWNYRLLHWNADPTDAERDSLLNWINASLKLLAAHGQVPFDQQDDGTGSDEGDEAPASSH